MKKSYLIAAGILSVFTALPALAGPDGQIIHDAEHQTASHEQQAVATEAVMPLDHGPRALTTPWMNKEEKLSILSRAQNSALTAQHGSAQHSPSHG